MQSHTVWGGIENSSVHSSSKDADCDSNNSSASGREHPQRNVPVGLRSYLEQVDFRDNSSSTSSVGTEGSFGGRYSRDRDRGSSAVGEEGEVSKLLKDRLQNRLGGDEASPSGQLRRRGALAKAASEILGEVTPEDKQVFEQVIADCGLWSKGCAQHSTRKCRPCHYVHCKTGCSNGADCEFCHFPHTDKNRQRIGMSKRLYCKSIAVLLEEACKGDAGKFEQVVRAASCMSAYLHSILLERLQTKEEGASCGHSPSGRRNIVSL